MKSTLNTLTDHLPALLVLTAPPALTAPALPTVIPALALLLITATTTSTGKKKLTKKMSMLMICMITKSTSIPRLLMSFSCTKLRVIAAMGLQFFLDIRIIIQNQKKYFLHNQLFQLS